MGFNSEFKGLTLPQDTGPSMQVILLELVSQMEVRKIASADEVRAKGSMRYCRTT